MIESINEILEERGSRYGPFSELALATQDLKGVIRDYLLENQAYQQLPRPDKAVVEEVLDMIALKIGRIVSGDPLYDDSWRDIAGYAELVVRHVNGENGQ